MPSCFPRVCDWYYIFWVPKVNWLRSALFVARVSIEWRLQVLLLSLRSELVPAIEALTAEDVCVQEFVAEFSLGVILLAQLNEIGELLID